MKERKKEKKYALKNGDAWNQNFSWVECVNFGEVGDLVS